jgi:hypothetical protein
MNTNKIITKETVVIDTPPDRETLLKMDYDTLKENTLKLNVSREEIDITDEDKGKIFMINECLRIRPPFPQLVKPVIIGIEHDVEKMRKKITGKYVKHVCEQNGKYSHSEITTESYYEKLQRADIDCREKENLLKSIKDEVSVLNLDEYKTKKSIMKFACDNGKSNVEKRRRAEALQRHLLDNNYGRHRITTYDISIY